MEKVLSSESGYVIRLPNVVGIGGNESNLVNYLTRSIKSKNLLKIQKNATRYLLGIEELKLLVQDIIFTGSGLRRVTSLVPPISIHVTKIVSIIEAVLKTRAELELVDSGSSYSVDFTDTEFHSRNSGYRFSIDYYEKLLEETVRLEP